MKKEINIAYIKGWAVSDEVLTPVYGHKRVSRLFTKHYHNAIFLLAGLNSSSRDLLEFLIQRMDQENVVLSNAKVREDFIKLIHMATDGNVTYTHNTVKKAFGTLAAKKLILPRKVRGSYTVNPEYFFKHDEKDRISQIKIILEDTEWRDDYNNNKQKEDE